jgi:Zn-dependent protease with chaperone function
MKKENQLQEFEPISMATGGVIASAVLIPLAIDLAGLFFSFQLMIRTTKEDKKLSKKLKSILKDGKDWKVFIIKDGTPNAFAMVRPYIFLSSGLVRMMNEREIIAIMLHETGHITNMHIWKDVATKSSLIALLFTTVAALSGPIALGALLFIWFTFETPEMILQGVLMRTMGRAEERQADNIPVKYGYGDDFISSLRKIEKVYQKMLKRHCTTFVCKTRERISSLLDEHPPIKQRVENILKDKETWSGKKSFVQYRKFFQNKLGIKKEG